MCKKILNSKKPDTIPDVYSWLKKEAKCENDTFFIKWANLL